MSSLPPVYAGLTDSEIIRGIGNQLAAVRQRAERWPDKFGSQRIEKMFPAELAWLESKGITPDDAIAACREWKANVDLRCQNSAPVGTANGFGIHAAGPSALDVMAGKASVADIEAHERRKDAAAEREIRAAEIERRGAALRSDPVAEVKPRRRGRLPKADAEALRTAMLAKISAHPAYLNDIEGLYRAMGEAVGKRTLESWIKEEDRKYRESVRAKRGDG